MEAGCVTYLSVIRPQTRSRLHVHPHTSHGLHRRHERTSSLEAVRARYSRGVTECAGRGPLPLSSSVPDGGLNALFAENHGAYSFGHKEGICVH